MHRLLLEAPNLDGDCANGDCSLLVHRRPLANEDLRSEVMEIPCRSTSMCEGEGLEGRDPAATSRHPLASYNSGPHCGDVELRVRLPDPLVTSDCAAPGSPRSPTPLACPPNQPFKLFSLPQELQLLGLLKSRVRTGDWGARGGLCTGILFHQVLALLLKAGPLVFLLLSPPYLPRGTHWAEVLRILGSLVTPASTVL